MAPVQRHRSASDLASMQAEVNKNVQWVRSKWFWLAYVILLVAFRLGLVLFFPKFPGSDAWEWTALNTVHGVVRAAGGQPSAGQLARGRAGPFVPRS